MKKLLDPVANAKTLGFIYILMGIIDLLSGLTEAVSLVFGVVLLVVGFGLRKSKLWGIYALGGLIILDLLIVVINNSQGYAISTGSVVLFAFDLIVFLWFFSAKDRFAKTK